MARGLPRGRRGPRVSQEQFSAVDEAILAWVQGGSDELGSYAPEPDAYDYDDYAPEAGDEYLDDRYSGGSDPGQPDVSFNPGTAAVVEVAPLLEFVEGAW